MPLIYFQERSIANRYKTELLNSSEWLLLTVRSSCSWGRWRKILCLLSAAVVRSDLCSPVSISEASWTIKALLSQAGLTAEQIFNAQCTKHIQRKKSHQPFWFVDGKLACVAGAWIILNYKLNWKRMNCLPVFRTRSCECGREVFQCCLFLVPLDWCLRLFAPLFGLFALLCSFQEP